MGTRNLTLVNQWRQDYTVFQKKSNLKAVNRMWYVVGGERMTTYDLLPTKYCFYAATRILSDAWIAVAIAELNCWLLYSAIF